LDHPPDLSQPPAEALHRGDGLLQSFVPDGGQQLEVLASARGELAGLSLIAQQSDQPFAEWEGTQVDLGPDRTRPCEVACVGTEAVADVDHRARTSVSQRAPRREARAGIKLP